MDPSPSVIALPVRSVFDGAVVNLDVEQNGLQRRISSIDDADDSFDRLRDDDSFDGRHAERLGHATSSRVAVKVLDGLRKVYGRVQF